MDTDFDTYIEDEEGRDFPEACIKCGWTEKVGEPDLVTCEECRELLCEEHRTLLDGNWFCFPCWKAQPDPDDLPDEAYAPDDYRAAGSRWGTP